MLQKAHKFCTVLFSRKIVLVSALVILFFAICAIASPLMAPCDPYEQDLSRRLEGVSSEHWLGTDQL